jgi:hypothetical protein
MAAVVWLSSQGMRSWLGVSHWARIADVAVSVPLGAVVYYVSAKWLGLNEIDAVIGSFIRPIRRRWQKKSV